MKALLSLPHSVLLPIILRIYWAYRTQRDGHSVETRKLRRHVYMGYRMILRKGVEIGKFYSIARQTILGVGNHNVDAVTATPFPNALELGRLVPLQINVPQLLGPEGGHDVLIGINSTMMSVVPIGNGAVVAANSVVTLDVPPYAIVGGSPVRGLRYRFSEETLAALQTIAWWDWDE
jgi:virginiamycin A acetyltransferase